MSFKNNLSQAWFKFSRQIKWAWQRVYYGYDDRVYFSLTWHLVHYMPKWIRDYQSFSTKPDEYWDNRNKELQEIIDGFEAAERILALNYNDKKKEQELKRIFNRGMDRFRDTFFSLWS